LLFLLFKKGVRSPVEFRFKILDLKSKFFLNYDSNREFFRSKIFETIFSIDDADQNDGSCGGFDLICLHRKFHTFLTFLRRTGSFSQILSLRTF
jgi:hypothetical protein